MGRRPFLKTPPRMYPPSWVRPSTRQASGPVSPNSSPSLEPPPFVGQAPEKVPIAAGLEPVLRRLMASPGEITPEELFVALAQGEEALQYFVQRGVPQEQLRQVLAAIGAAQRKRGVSGPSESHSSKPWASTVHHRLQTVQNRRVELETLTSMVGG